jgi:CRISPR-associated protein Cmr6
MKLPPNHLHPRSNAAWLYEKAYFFDLNWKAGDKDESNQRLLEQRNHKLFAIRFGEAPPSAPLANQHIELWTTYPGLLAGTGYSHEMGFLGEMKLGFSLDYTSGRPYLPGSSVKGILRSPFRQQAFREYLRALLQAIAGPLPEDMPELLHQLEMEIFEGRRAGKQDAEASPEAYEPLPQHQRDLFFDAFAIESQHNSHHAEERGAFLGPDFIAPHLNREHPEMSPFTNPTPIAFVKVLPEVRFRFEFRLHDSVAWPALTADKKQALFRELLLDLGAGAKTRTGYGRLKDKADSQRAELGAEGAQASDNPSAGDTGAKLPPSPPSLPTYTQKDFNHLYKSAGALIACVVGNQGGKLECMYILDGQEHRASVSYRASSEFSIGQWVELKISDVGNLSKGKKPTFGFKGKHTP